MPLNEEQTKVNLKKVAILLTLLGRDAAQEIIRHFSTQDIERIGKEMAKGKEISRAEQEQVLQDFLAALKDRNFPLKSGMEYVEQVLAPALDPDRAQRFLRKIHSPRQIAPFEELQEVEPEHLVAAVKGEHPQTVALVLASLPRDLSAKVLRQLPQALQSEIVRRIALLDRQSPDLSTVREIEQRLSARIKQEMEKPEMIRLGGAQTTADLFNLLEKDLAHQLLEGLEAKHEDLAAQIKVKMVRFDDLTKLTDMEIQRLLKEVETQDLALACVKLDPQLSDMIFRNMSHRGAEMLKDDIEVMQNVKPESVRASRQKIADVMRRLDEEGTIILNKQNLEDNLV
ncbi:MAG: flagellar motor switch protein FliG [candidate division FCPU426 bacterium]